ncbi:MAG: type II/IV secretion system protein [Planctomycetaceae bacterium]|jgi:type IV pilus assembly protein PilB|nr:type II/IV secretion system protein [Planctomycetaceae bacterium]
MSQPTTKARLGDRLLERGLITANQLGVALSEQKRAYRPLGQILVGLGFVRVEMIAELVAEDLGVPFLRASQVEPDPLVLASIDRDFVQSTGAFPIRLEGDQLLVAMLDPDSPERLSGVRSRFPYPLKLAITTEADLAALMRKHLPELEGQVAKVFDALEISAGALDDEFPVENVTLAMLIDGVHRGATDIHVEPEEKVTRVRYRIDGILQQGENLPRPVTDAIISRIKILASLDISERRRPQDGRLRVRVDERNVDMRVSIMPSADGENVVLRILDRGAVALRLAELGIAPRVLTLLRKVQERPHGLFLVTGPTGSGKTTTLYSMLAEMDAVHDNIATIEDPVEYRLPLVRQSQVDPSIGFGFQEGLRSLLRQDPDVILVGEIRDKETAEMAIKASMTGHLVFSTLHTNSAIGAIPRLIDLGVDPFLVEDSLIGVLAQRLVRTVCVGCAQAVLPTPEELIWLEGRAGNLRRGTGCSRCRGSGYSGRSALSELFLPDDGMAQLLRSGKDLIALREHALASGFVDLLEDGREKVRAGVTTVDEVERIHRSHRLSKEERAHV